MIASHCSLILSNGCIDVATKEQGKHFNVTS